MQGRWPVVGQWSASKSVSNAVDWPNRQERSESQRFAHGPLAPALCGLSTFGPAKREAAEEKQNFGRQNTTALSRRILFHYPRRLRCISSITIALLSSPFATSRLSSLHERRLLCRDLPANRFTPARPRWIKTKSSPSASLHPPTTTSLASSSTLLHHQLF